jgi:Flp pilus assembly protein TadB
MSAAFAGLLAMATVLAAGWRLRPAGRAHTLPAVDAGERRRRPALARLCGHRIVAGGGSAIAFAAGLLLLGPGGGLAGAAGVVVARRLVRQRKTRQHAAARTASLPAALDLLVVALSGGATVRQGLRLVSERGPPLLRPAFAEVVGRMDAGEALAVALPRLIVDVGEPVRGLVRAIVVADRDGVPLRALLGRIADDARRQRRHALEAAIRRLPVRLAFPLVGCILPAFVVLTVVPVIGAGLRRLGPLGS